MIPGIRQAILLSDTCGETDSNIQWPKAATIHDDVYTTARLAANQEKTITTALSSVQGNDSAVDTVIALPLTGQKNFTATLALLVNIKPSQETVVMQILHWGESWMQLLLQQQDNKQQVTDVPTDVSKSAKGFSFHNQGMGRCGARDGDYAAGVLPCALC